MFKGFGFQGLGFRVGLQDLNFQDSRFKGLGV